MTNKKSGQTLILGAGPAGLAAGYVLAKAGYAPVIIEKSKSAGGLMRSIHRGDFILDIGRKELYNRLQKVDDLWRSLLGDDYRPYPHRGGILFRGDIIDISPKFRGVRRGMPWAMAAGCAFDLIASRLKHDRSKPQNLEQYFYSKRGQRLTQVISQGFQEKLSGIKWRDVSLPETYGEKNEASLYDTLSGLATRAFARQEVNTFRGEWSHPAKGTGQICESLEAGIREHGGQFIFNASLNDIHSAGGIIDKVDVEVDGKTIEYSTGHVISSIPAPALLKLVLGDRYAALDDSLKSPPSSKRTIVLVYLFLNEPPKFPHAWLNVTCPDTKIGRITNYSGLGGEMVPEGKACLCCEFFCSDTDDTENDAFARMAIADCARYGLLTPEACFDKLVLKLPGADASQNRHNWMSAMRSGLFAELGAFSNLFHVGRTDLDIATLAGLEAAEAIMSGDRTKFDRDVDPNNLDIRSNTKAFEFRNPLEQGI